MMERLSQRVTPTRLARRPPSQRSAIFTGELKKSQTEVFGTGSSRSADVAATGGGNKSIVARIALTGIIDVLLHSLPERKPNGSVRF